MEGARSQKLRVSVDQMFDGSPTDVRRKEPRHRTELNCLECQGEVRLVMDAEANCSKRYFIAIYVKQYTVETA
eukprot:8033470-Karenia_brevis.AAC.2